MTRICIALAILAASATAHADDEGSEHTAQLYGASGDTLGVTVGFKDTTGWSMTVRARPGADSHTYTLSLPKHHAHYVVYVAPGRTAIAFVEVSAGITAQRARPTAHDPIAWVWSPDGQLVKTWTYGDALTAAELRDMPRSVSHYTWTDGIAATKSGLELAVKSSKRQLVLAEDARSLR